MPLDLLKAAGGGEKEPQRHDAGVEGRRRYARIGHVQLIGAQVIGCGGVR